MGFEALKDSWFIARDTSQHSNMFCSIRELYWFSINLDGIDSLPVFNRVLRILLVVNLQLGLV